MSDGGGTLVEFHPVVEFHPRSRGASSHGIHEFPEPPRSRSPRIQQFDRFRSQSREKLPREKSERRPSQGGESRRSPSIPRVRKDDFQVGREVLEFQEAKTPPARGRKGDTQK